MEASTTSLSRSSPQCMFEEVVIWQEWLMRS